MNSAVRVARLRVCLRGAVQGVGFRPFVYRLASALSLAGWVRNNASGVELEVEGPEARLCEFLTRLERDRPPHSFIHGLEPTLLEARGYSEFVIRDSEGGEKSAFVVPDIATCEDCLRELFDPLDRRYRYPFLNCTHCGPRYSIIERLPYDRPNTTMHSFEMCAECRAEYEDPLDRRFHAQPNACPRCGPHVEWWDSRGTCLAVREEALSAASEAIRQGRIVAVKGLGGFHLFVAASDAEAVKRLRLRKHREEKPFALLFPSMREVALVCETSPLEERLLRSPEAPIVLLRRKVDGSSDSPRVCAEVAPQNPCLGAFLPYTPLHHLLLGDLGFPVVATSGNRSEEPIRTEEHEAVRRLGDIADFFLVHNRPIRRPVDDSIARVLAGREMVLRRARGYAPLPFLLANDIGEAVAVGAHLKNTVAVAKNDQVFLSQHIGDLETAETHEAFLDTLHSLETLYEARPSRVVCDLHPEYLSTQYALERDSTAVRVQHHYAHALACLADNEIEPPALAVVWDGTGYGPDGTVWGGEFLRIGECGFERAAHFRTFPLPGGDHAVREPRRSALGVLAEVFGLGATRRTDLPSVAAFSRWEVEMLTRALEAGVNSPRTSSVGRLFDAVASLLGLCQVNRHEGQAAMALEFAASSLEGVAPYPFRTLESPGRPLVLDWGDCIASILEERAKGVEIGRIAARFHVTLVEIIARTCSTLGETRVLLTGGCFQNRILLEASVAHLSRGGFSVFRHQRVPPNDGGIALGQLAALLREPNLIH